MRTAESPADYTSRGWNDNIRGRTNWIQRTLDWQAGRPNMFHHRPLGQPRRAYGSTALQFSSGTVPCSEKYQRLYVREREKERKRDGWEFSSVMPNTVDNCNKALSLEVECFGPRLSNSWPKNKHIKKNPADCGVTLLGITPWKKNTLITIMILQY